MNSLCIARRLRVVWQLSILQDTHDDGTTTVSSSVLGQVVATGKLLAALVAFERLVVSVERSDVSLEVFLASKPAVADIADERLGRIFREGLLAATTVDWS